MKHADLPTRQSGLSLIELMVAMTLGLMITMTLGYILMGSRSTYRTQDASARVQDTGRFALEYIGRQIRLAGRTDISPLDSVAVVYVTDPITPSTAAANRLSNATQLTVQYQDSQDCNGIGVATVINTINRDGNQQLQCQGTNEALPSQPFAEEVEELQFRYATVNAAGVVTWAATPTAPVVAVEVCIRVRSSANGVLNATQIIRNCAGTDIADPGDTRLRRTFTSVFAVRNNIPAVPTP